MCEEPVRTRVQTADGWRDLQQYLVAEHAEAPVEGIEVDVVRDGRFLKVDLIPRGVKHVNIHLI